MVVTQQNYIIEDVPGNWIEIIYVQGITVNAGAQSNNTLSLLKAGGRFKAGCACIAGATNTAKFSSPIIAKPPTSSFNYGDIIPAAGILFQIANLDVVNETGLSVIITIRGG